MSIDDKELIRYALHATKEVRRTAEARQDWKLMGWVGAALLTSQGNVFTGVNIHLLCGMGICAEYSAVAEMIKHGETIIDKIVAITAEGSILPPCGRCREMLYQINALNLNTAVFISDNETKPLRDLLPFHWQDNFDRALY
jgi:cytidine deaminase